MVCEYKDVFLDELSGLPPHRDVDFIIELHLGTSPISMTPHRMTSFKVAGTQGPTAGIVGQGIY